MANNSFVCFFNGQMIIKAEQHALNINSLHDLVAHLVVHRAVTREVVSSTGPILRVFK